MTNREEAILALQKVIDLASKALEAQEQAIKEAYEKGYEYGVKDWFDKRTKNTTNGDVIKAMFPNGIYDEQQNLFESEDYTIVILSDVWWNAPYKAESDKESEK